MAISNVSYYGLAFLLFLLSVVSYGNEIGNPNTFSRIGSLDYISETEIVVSDIAYPISTLVSCLDAQGKKYVGCSGLERARWVEIQIDFDTKAVVKIKRLSTEQ